MATASLLIFIPLFFICLAASLAFLVLLAIWLYRDAKLHGQDPVLWVLICIFASPILALILWPLAARKLCSPARAAKRPFPTPPGTVKPAARPTSNTASRCPAAR